LSLELSAFKNSCRLTQLLFAFSFAFIFFASNLKPPTPKAYRLKPPTDEGSILTLYLFTIQALTPFLLLNFINDPLVYEIIENGIQLI
jgi:hypothetical protein